MEPLYWQIFFWLIQLVIFVPLSVFASVQWLRILDRKNSRLVRLLEGEWQSSFMLVRNGEWVDQKVVVRRAKFSQRLLLTATGDSKDLEWSGFLEPHGSMMVGGWENTPNPIIVGAQTLNLRFLLGDEFLVGATTAADENTQHMLRVSTWVMARSKEKLEKAKNAVAPS